ncbi:PH domain-containing protein [Candidatus Nanohalococcus occultus]|uniref:PH domain-containing protein n=1 Tax=Candidatus Nanohalococcus occultus TaxID=2978047 RepID=UPI0039E034BD
MKLDRKSIVYNALQDVGTIAVFLVFTGGASVTSLNFSAAAIVAAVLTALTVVTLVWEYLVWRNYSFYIREENINIRHGVFQKKSREIPLGRIQNVDIKKNVVQRVLGIAKVSLETAGGGHTEASLKFIGDEQARQFQRKIRNLKKGVEDTEEADEDRELIYEISDRELGVLGVTSVKPGLIFGLMGLLGVGGGLVLTAVEQSGLSVLLGLSIILVLGLAGVWATSFTSVLLKYYGFKLWRSDDSLEYERGFLNRSEGSIPLEKIQKLTVEENPLKRLFGYSTLKIETAGYSAQNSMEGGPESAIPLTKRNRAIRLANKIEPFGEINTVSIPGKARRRYFGRYMILNAAVTAGTLTYAYFTGSYLIAGAVFTALTVLSITAAHLKWKNKGYQVGEDKIVTMNGFWKRETMIVPYYRIQNLIETQTVFQRRWNLSSLVLDIAGTNLFQKDAKITDLDTEQLRQVKEQCYRKLQDSL